MTRRSILFSGVIALAAIALAAPAAFSRGPDGPGGGFGKRGGERGARLVQALDLSEEQAAALKTLREEQQATAKATRQGLREKRQAIRAQWQSGNPDRATLLALTSEVSAIEAQLATSRVGFMFAAKDILTPEQFAKFTKFAGKRGGFGKRGFGKRGHGFHKRGFGRQGKRGGGEQGMRGKRGKRGFGKRGGHFSGPPTPPVDGE